MWKRDFFSADHSIKWVAAEELHTLWLDARTAIVGTIDAQGETEDGRRFFADWKTLNKRKAANMQQVKAEWRMDPQALTYGLLLGDAIREFTVRWAIKGQPPTTDFEWYSYTAAELVWWKGELLNAADELRRLRNGKVLQWPTNLTNCTRYGWNYRCPLYDNGCPKLNFEHDPGLPKRTHNVEIEEKLALEHEMKGHPPGDLVVLSSSSLEKWLGCKEQYRRFYEGDGMEETSEALQLGTEFHLLMKEYYRSLICSSQ